MVCQECQERPAALHFTKVVNGEKTEVHLCETCAQDKGDSFLSNEASAFSFNNLLAGLLNISPVVQQSQAAQERERVTCSHCEMSFQQFLKIGKFGCAQCYRSFAKQLPPVVERLHSGSSVHHGKLPARAGGTVQLKRQIGELRQQLRSLIDQEEFEQAAEIRDEIRLLERRVKTEGGDEA